ncbi:DUF4123 domain-containing protein [Halomonas sp. ML-15]|uniref:DUF4123 domain-containing protein n=1 Tax=Halomonas sp. ML-15 TaxID=2773305 RepID=UPI0017477510|nr:DUF4123 domain-containing protein [Halomonas sp. ML-15]MBD3895309.1 DUF4123 domain-containing protein [Halomonas sp. ML-15]
MSGWLKHIAERGHPVDSPATSFGGHRPAYMVLDQRRASGRCADLIGQPGWRDFLTLFATTPLAPLIDASPWLIELDVGSVAWHSGETLCREQHLGWIFQPAQATSLNDLADHLRRLFVLDDPHGGQSLVNLQAPTAWTALLAASSDTAYAQLIGPLGRVVTPTPLSHWQVWQPVDDADNVEIPPLTQTLEIALKESPRGWWLSQATDTPLQALPAEWLERLGQLEAAGIHQAHHLQRLLPKVCEDDADWWAQASTMQLLQAARPAWQKVDALEASA